MSLHETAATCFRGNTGTQLRATCFRGNTTGHRSNVDPARASPTAHPRQPCLRSLSHLRHRVELQFDTGSRRHDSNRDHTNLQHRSPTSHPTRRGRDPGLDEIRRLPGFIRSAGSRLADRPAEHHRLRGAPARVHHAAHTDTGSHSARRLRHCRRRKARLTADGTSRSRARVDGGTSRGWNVSIPAPHRRARPAWRMGALGMQVDGPLAQLQVRALDEHGP